MGGRQILDSVLIANDYVDSCVCVRSKIPGVICKLDTEKTYDHINWEALIYLLGRMGLAIIYAPRSMVTKHFCIATLLERTTVSSIDHE